MFKRLLVIVMLCLMFPLGASAQTYVGGASATNTDTTPTLSYSATSGNFLLALVTVNDSAGTATCTPPSGWTEIHADEPVYANYVLCAATKTATGSDSYSWTISSTFSWALGVVEFNGVSTTATTYGLADQNDVAPTVTASGASASGELVIAGIIDTYDASLTAPSGYTGLTLSPASGVHYGGNFVAMGGLAYKISSGATESATWGQSDGHFTGLAIYSFAPSGSPPAGACNMTLLGTGKCGE